MACSRAPATKPAVAVRLTRPARDATGMGVDDKGDVDEAGPGGDVEPAPAKAGVKSLTHSWFGEGAWNCRFTQSSGQGAAEFWTIVGSLQESALCARQMRTEDERRLPQAARSDGRVRSGRRSLGAGWLSASQA